MAWLFCIASMILVLAVLCPTFLIEGAALAMPLIWWLMVIGGAIGVVCVIVDARRH